MATSTVLPPLTATYSGTYPASTIVSAVPAISANSVRASILVYLSPIDAQLSLQFSPTVDIGGTYGTPPATIISTLVPLYDGAELAYIFTEPGDVVGAVSQAVAWTTAVAALVSTAITDMRTTDAAIVIPPGATITTV